MTPRPLPRLAATLLACTCLLSLASPSRAQTALQRGLGQSALDALAEHRRRFPRGQLTEEREALVVQALARAGRDDEAAEAARRFEARYPSSLLRPVVRQAVGAR